MRIIIKGRVDIGTQMDDDKTRKCFAEGEKQGVGKYTFAFWKQVKQVGMEDTGYGGAGQVKGG